MPNLTDSWGYIEVDICPRHSSPNVAHLFAHSGTPDKVMCVPCWLGRYDLEAPNADDFPILDLVRNCQVCGKPEGDGIRQVLTLAYLKDGTEIFVHRYSCCYADECNDCHRRFAREVWDYNGVINRRLFSHVSETDDYLRCTDCSNTYIEDCGGIQYFFTCNHCDNLFHRDHRNDYMNNCYCNSCYQDNSFDCENCGESRFGDYDHDCHSGLIHDYSYKPDPVFFGEGSYHMGFELEVESQDANRHHGAEWAVSALGSHAYLKSDGSLDDGFEIVTHPHTLHEYQKNFDWGVLIKLRKQGFRSWDTSTCGLHVHVSREAFGESIRYDTTSAEILRRQAHELRFMKLIYDNQRQVQRIAGRSSGYASFADKGKLIPKVKHGQQSQGHSSAVNTDNFATLEIRVFKGSLRKERVLSALEFVTACVEYTRDLHVSGTNKALSWLRFTAYVSGASESYPNLALVMSETFTNDTDPSDDNN